MKVSIQREQEVRLNLFSFVSFHFLKQVCDHCENYQSKWQAKLPPTQLLVSSSFTAHLLLLTFKSGSYFYSQGSFKQQPNNLLTHQELLLLQDHLFIIFTCFPFINVCFVLRFAPQLTLLLKQGFSWKLSLLLSFLNAQSCFGAAVKLVIPHFQLYLTMVLASAKVAEMKKGLQVQRELCFF